MCTDDFDEFLGLVMSEDEEITADGLPRYAVDLPDVHYEGDLADYVLPLWSAAGIEFEFYSSGCGSAMMMIDDPARLQEAKDIVLIALMALEELSAEVMRRLIDRTLERVMPQIEAAIKRNGECND